MKRLRMTVVGMLVAGAGLAALPPGASANRAVESVQTFDYSQNMLPLGESPRPNPAPFVFNTDLAFWGSTAYQGTYDGFRIVDISAPGNPKTILDYDECFGNQGDLIVWDDILVRSWNSPAPPGATCDGEPVAPGVFGNWEGLHVFDISNPLDPDLVASIETECGSHTATGVPDVDNGRLLIYNSSSSGACPGIDIIEVPLDAPDASSYLRFEPAGRRCHDTGVILGDAMLAGCAGGDGFTIWSMAAADGGSLEDPEVLVSQTVPGVTIGHTGAFTWDGEVFIFGHEPGGGGQPRCQESNAAVDKTLFFFDARTGAELGTWEIERPQSATENCTIHNLNVVPTTKGYVLVSGNYQMGIAVIDFTDPANAAQIAYADPAPLSTEQLVLGGDWSTYWYDGRIYQSDITRGLVVWDVSDPAVAGAHKLGHLNPQTQEFTLG